MYIIMKSHVFMRVLIGYVYFVEFAVIMLI